MLLASLNRETRIEQSSPTTMIAMNNPAPVPHAGPTSRDPFSGGLIGDIINAFGYTDTEVNAALAATEAMAVSDPALEEWRQSVDADALKVHAVLGIFNDPIQAISVADSFAMLGAVDEETLDLGGNPATRLTLTHLKPGVARADVVSLARQLGLKEPVL
jgi:rare lipoprotein A